MPFLASCPFCPAKIKLSRKKLGSSVQCEQCGNHFTAVPPDDVTSGPSTYRQLAVNAVIAPSVATATDESSAEPPAFADGTFQSPAQTELPDFIPPGPAIPAWINIWGFVCFFLTSAAMFFATFGLLRQLAIPLAGVGLLVCLVGIPLTPRKKPNDLAWLGGASVLAVLFLLVAFIWPSLLNRYWRIDQALPAIDPAKQFLAARDNQAPRERELDGQTWIDADNHAVRQGDIHVRVEEVKIELDATKETPTPSNSLIRLRLSNLGQLHRYTYRSPVLAGQPPTLRDNRGKSYALRSDARASPAPRTLKPLASVYDHWTCEPIDAGIEYLDLEVPAAAWAGKGSCKFRIPHTMIAFPAKE